MNQLQNPLRLYMNFAELHVDIFVPTVPCFPNQNVQDSSVMLADVISPFVQWVPVNAVRIALLYHTVMKKYIRQHWQNISLCCCVQIQRNDEVFSLYKYFFHILRKQYFYFDYLFCVQFLIFDFLVPFEVVMVDFCFFDSTKKCPPNWVTRGRPNMG